MRIAKTLGDRLDLYGAGAGLIALGSLILVLIAKHYNPIYIVAFGFGILAIALYLIFRNRLRLLSKAEGVLPLGNHQYLYMALGCYGAALVVFVGRADQYVKPTAYYIFIAASVAFAVLAVLKERTPAWWVVGLAVAIGLTHIWTENMMFPSVLGLDPWAHEYVTENLTSIPPIPDMGGGISLMHVLLKGIMLTGLSYKMASLIFWGSLQTVGIIVLIFLIGRQLISKEVGLIGALLVSSANWVIFFGEWIIPNGMGATLSLLVAYLFIKAHKSNKPWLASLSLIVLGVAFLTHLIASAWVFGTIICMSLAYFKEQRAYTLSTSAVGTLGLGVWYFASGVGRASRFFDTGTYPIGNAPTLGFNYIQGFSWEMLLNSSGMFLYFGLGVIGLLIMAKLGRFQRVWGLLIAGVFIMGIVPPLFGRSFIEHRWWYFADALICVPLAVAIASIYPMRRGLVVIPCVGVVVFLSMVGLPSNTTNRSLSRHQIVRYALTQGELDSIPIAKSFSPKLLGTDPLLIGPLVAEEQNHTAVSIETNILTDNFTGSPCDVIILRDALYKEPFGYGSGAIYSLKTTPVIRAEVQGYIEVWHNTEAHVLVKK